MTEVTDKMVEAGWRRLEVDGDMRAAIEAALAERKSVNAGQLVKSLRGGHEFYDVGEAFEEFREAADAIEELVDVLAQAVSDFGEGHCVCEQTKQQCATLLTRMGVKL